MSKTAFLLSGQGAQKPGMGAGLVDAGIPEVDEVFAEASQAFGFDVADAALHADADRLNDTAVAQPVMCATSVAVARALQARGVQPGYVLGFSLGQISALAVSGMLSLQDTFRLAAFRAQAMAEAAVQQDGAMCALMGGTPEEVEALCGECAQSGILVPANYNAPGQVVVSGDRAAILRAQEAWSGPGKRSALLATSGAFHSPLMQPAADALEGFLQTVDFQEPRIPLICNVTAQPLDAAHARQHLVDQVKSPVLFSQSVSWLAGQGVTNFVECGFGGVLAGLVRRIDKSAARLRVENQETLAAALEQLL